MNTWIGSALALLAFIAGGILWGWKGVILALSVVVFWLLLQFGRLMRIMRAASEAPVGQIDSAVMLNSKLQVGMKLIDLLPLSRSLGRKLTDSPETYGWIDAGGVQLEIVMDKGRVISWALNRPAEPGDTVAQSTLPTS
ncbi:hypothetical protein [Roseateles oligotrophus]|uniref:NfeD-like C-terminal domain-containing protein n=1 Tax=Roseateles oligotrophus TaxID=1769250 RepID=A0ABT2YCS8_9BURK|nr:hypothetical protein [Roseateles oligotrophus]MCV2367831.1 hypothetical protein [Roseateles oligotrophus]